MTSREPTTDPLEGVLVPSGWSWSEEALELSLMTFDEREIPVDPSVVSALHLGDLVRQRVRLWATCSGGRVVHASRVEVLTANRRDRGGCEEPK